MDFYKIKNKKTVFLRHNDLTGSTAGKELQPFIEENMEGIFSLKFIASGFSFHRKELDGLDFDEKIRDSLLPTLRSEWIRVGLSV